MNFCPQCGTPFEPGARFCMHCGFDKLSLTIAKPEETGAPGMLSEKDSEKSADPETLTPDENRVQKACPQCGKSHNPGSRVCIFCGFEMDKAAEPVAGFKPVELPRSIFNHTADQSKPIVTEEKPVPDAQLQKQEISPAPDPVVTQKQVFTPPAAQQPLAVNKKTGKRKVLIFISIVVLGSLGWIGYNTWQGMLQDDVSDSIPNMQLPPIDDTASAVGTMPAADETPAETQTETQQAELKPVSKIDQELAKQKANTKNKNATVAVPTPLPKTTVQNRESDHAQVSEKSTTIIFEVGRKEDARSKNPKNPSKFSIQSPTMIVRITTDHYNDGMGTPTAGKISILDRDGNNIGTFKAYGKTGNDGTPNAKWVCEPHKVLEKGTYKILDSDMSTWSKTFLGTGFVVIEGYEME